MLSSIYKVIWNESKLVQHNHFIHYAQRKKKQTLKQFSIGKLSISQKHTYVIKRRGQKADDSI